MFCSFNEMLEHWQANAHPARIGVACPEDELILRAVLRARDAGVVRPVLVGDARKITALLDREGESPDGFEIVDQPDGKQAGQYVARGVASGEFAAPMKGHMHTSYFLRPLLDKELGIVPKNGLLNQITIYEEPAGDRLRLICDCAVNIAPDLDQLAAIVQNAVNLARNLGCARPRVAVVAPLEVVNPDIPSSVNAALLAKMGDRGRFGDADVDGPLALDLAVSPQAAQLKGISGPVAGNADIMVAPNLDAGNMTHKALVHIAGLKTAGIVTGANSPIIMTSRTDSTEDKMRSILASMVAARAQGAGS
ncbi:MAG: phosphate acyltransferase [Desulfovibrio sp.]|nr:phosphate acyltransferase [Desulfovibrio sp.]